MPTLQIRNLPDDVYQALAFRAERAQRSLAQQALVELRGGESETPRERRLRILAQVGERIAAGGALELPPELAPEVLIRADRER